MILTATQIAATATQVAKFEQLEELRKVAQAALTLLKLAKAPATQHAAKQAHDAARMDVADFVWTMTDEELEGYKAWHNARR